MNSSDLPTGFVTFFLLAVVGVLAVQGGGAGKGDTFQTRLFMYAFGVRFAASVVIYSFGLIDTIKDEDGSGWVIGKAFSAEWGRQGRTFTNLPEMIVEGYQGRNKGYWYILGIFFFFSGLDSRLAAAALNGFFGAMTVVLSYRTCRMLLPERSAQWVGWVSCLLPSLILWSAQTVKEPAVIFLESVAMYSCLRLRTKTLNLKYLLMCLGAVVLLASLRFYASYVAAVSIVLGLTIHGVGMGRAGGVFAGGLLMAAVVAAFGGFLQKEANDQIFEVTYVQKFREGAVVGQGSGVVVEGDLNTSSGFGSALVVGGLHLLFAPFPWQWTSVRALMVAPDVIFWWWVCWNYVRPGLREIVVRRLADFAPVLVFIILMLLLYSVMFSNVGLAYRQRAQLLPWLLIIAAAGREVCLRREKASYISLRL